MGGVQTHSGSPIFLGPLSEDLAKMIDMYLVKNSYRRRELNLNLTDHKISYGHRPDITKESVNVADNLYFHARLKIKLRSFINNGVDNFLD